MPAKFQDLRRRRNCCMGELLSMIVQDASHTVSEVSFYLLENRYAMISEVVDAKV